MHLEEFQLYELPNGIRVVHKEVTTTKICHCGFLLDIGSRDEGENQIGLTHFWEHMAFKGTQKRKAFHIINRLESVGGELNAYTTKEKIQFYASVLAPHYEKAIDLLKDITFNSIFPEKEIIREKNVILEEMSMYKDTPEDAIFDEFDELIFKGHPLGNNILGTEQSVNSFEQKDFYQFLEEKVDTSRIIFSSVGNIPFAKVKKYADKYLKDIPTQTSQHQRIHAAKYIPSESIIKKNIHQSHCIVGRDAYSIQDKKRIPLYMLTQLLGGPFMSSRLNMSLREKMAYVYNVEANYHSFTDTGQFGIYFGTEQSKLNRSIKLVHKELKKLREIELGTNQLHVLKEQMKAQIAMGEESNVSLMQIMGKSLLDVNKIPSLTELFHEIDTIDASYLRDIANEIFNPAELSTISYIKDHGVS